MSQSSYFKSRPDLVTSGGGGVGGGGLKSWKMLRVEGSTCKLVVKIIRSPRYLDRSPRVLDVTGTDPLSSGSWGGGVNSEDF